MKQTLIIICLLLAGVAGVLAILSSGSGAQAGAGHDHPDEHAGEHDAGHAGKATAEAERGPHGGRLLRDGTVSVELQIHEVGGPPRFRLYAWQDGQPVPAERLEASVELTRLGGQVDRFTFTPRGEYLEGQGIVAEPHSFDVSVRATAGGATHTWVYPSYEARVAIDPDLAARSGVEVARAGPALIRETLLLYGTVIADDRRVRTVRARFPGVVRTVRKNLGDRVSANETLATIESNESLETYPVRSPIAGVVLTRGVNPGENVADQPLFTIADLSTVRAEFAVFRRDLPRVRVGQTVQIRADDSGTGGTGTIDFISPVGSGASQSVKLLVSLDNSDGRWQPGIFVTGEVETTAVQAEVAVARTGLQKYREFDVVFTRVGSEYEPRMLELGRAGRNHVEVKSGLAAGDTYVTANSFLVKAEIGKAGAGHDH